MQDSRELEPVSSQYLDNAVAEARSKLDQARGLYHQLVLVVARARGGKTILLNKLSQDDGLPLLNVNLLLSELLLGVPARRRGIEAPRLFQQKLDTQSGPVVLLDNLEILFDPTLSLNPLGLLKHMSRSRTLLASWPGHISDGSLVYAEPGHPEYRCDSAADLLTLSPSHQNQPEALHSAPVKP